MYQLQNSVLPATADYESEESRKGEEKHKGEPRIERDVNMTDEEDK